MSTATASTKVFDADAARFERIFREADALVTEPDGFVWIDESKVTTSVVRSYRRFVQYGAANGLL